MNRPPAPRIFWVRVETARIPAYQATINGNAMDVWQVMPGEWRINVNRGRRYADVGAARTHHEGKRMAAAWAYAHPPGSYRWVRRWRLGSRAWDVEANGSHDADET